MDYKAMERQIEGTGDLAGVAEFRALALLEEVSKRTNVSIDDTIQIAQAYAQVAQSMRTLDMTNALLEANKQLATLNQKVNDVGVIMAG